MNKPLILVCLMLGLSASLCIAQGAGTEYIVTVTIAGSGRVLSSPPGIACTQAGGDCSARFPTKTPVTLTPQEEPQFTFYAWSAATGSAVQCPSTNGPCSFVLDSDTAVAATFVPAAQAHHLPIILDGPAVDDLVKSEPRQR